MMTPINQMIRFGSSCSRTYTLVVDEQVKKEDDKRISLSQTQPKTAGDSARGK